MSKVKKFIRVRTVNIKVWTADAPDPDRQKSLVYSVRYGSLGGRTTM